MNFPVLGVALLSARQSLTDRRGRASCQRWFLPFPSTKNVGCWEAKFVNRCAIGQPAKGPSTILSVDLKMAPQGTLVFVNLQHDIHQNGELCVTQIQNIVYREQPTSPSPLLLVSPRTKPPDSPKPWTLTRAPFPILGTHLQIPNPTDRPTPLKEFYPALVVHGPLLVTLLLNLKQQHLPGRLIREYHFRAVRPTFDVNPLKLEGCLKG